jgi:hypothetical protein
MSNFRQATFSDCPISQPETEFKYNEHDTACNLDVEFGVGVDAYKDACESFIDVNADMGSTYPLAVAVKIKGEWHYVEEVAAVRVIIRGEYERNSFRHALQKVGLMTLPVYGKMKSDKELWEEENAIREQT